MVNCNKNKYNSQYIASLNQFYDFGYHKFNLNKWHNEYDKNGFFRLENITKIYRSPIKQFIQSTSLVPAVCEAGTYMNLYTSCP